MHLGTEDPAAGFVHPGLVWVFIAEIMVCRHINAEQVLRVRRAFHAPAQLGDRALDVEAVLCPEAVALRTKLWLAQAHKNGLKVYPRLGHLRAAVEPAYAGGGRSLEKHGQLRLAVYEETNAAVAPLDPCGVVGTCQGQRIQIGVGHLDGLCRSGRFPLSHFVPPCGVGGREILKRPLCPEAC